MINHCECGNAGSTNFVPCNIYNSSYSVPYFQFTFADINECKEKKACQCPECSCRDTWGDYECTCSGDLLYIKEHDTCISKTAVQGKAAWAAVWGILIVLVVVAAGSYVVYKYRLRSYMDSEIRAIMAQYMPLDSQGEVPNHTNDEEHH
jgi:hypothetical protein